MTHDAETVEADWEIVAKAIYEAAEPFEYKESLSWEDFEPEARAALSSIQPSVKDAAKVLLDEYGRVRSGRLDKVQPHDGYIAALSGSALSAISEGE